MSDPTDPDPLEAAITAQEDQVRAQMRDRMSGMQDLVETDVAAGIAGDDPDESPVHAAQYAFLMGAQAALSSFIDAVFQAKVHPEGIQGAEDQVAAERVLLQGLLDYTSDGLVRKGVQAPWERQQGK